MEARPRPPRESTGGASSRRKSGSSARTQQAGDLPVPTVNWVMCNKCKKWRKVPEHIRMEVLPDKWFCSLNTWAPAFARCAAKEEQADPEAATLAVSGVDSAQEFLEASNLAFADGPGVGAKQGRETPARKRQQASAAVAVPAVGTNSGTQAAAPGGIKKVSWVQCERRSCAWLTAGILQHVQV